MAAQPFAGVLVPVLTPFTRTGEPDAGRFVAFCRWLLDQGADGLAIFGTTSEANSMSGVERMELLDRLIASGIPAAKLMPGAGACSVTEAAALCRHAVGHGVGGVLMLPPFYYKGMDDDGLFAFFAGVIDRVGSAALRMYLYHIPPQTILGLSLDLVGRLIEAYPETVVGLKDSSGDWNNTAELGAADVPLPHPAADHPRPVARPRRPPDRGLPGNRCRPQGQLRRLEQHRRADRTLPRGRGLPGVGSLSARRLAQGRGRLQHRDRQRQRARHPQGLRELEDAAGRRAAGRNHAGAQDDPGLPDGAGPEAYRRAFPS